MILETPVHSEVLFMCAIMGYTGTDIPMEKLLEGFGRTKSRGPDDSRVQEVVSCSRDSGFEITQIKERRGWAAIRAVLK